MQTVSHYRIIDELGRGGMGEVFLAEDTNLDRRVAVKVLPDAFLSDPERVARFEREAKLLASLNHPNIAAIYGLEQAEGKRFIAMEFVGGQSLAQRLHKGSLPVDETLAICRQIAEGLEAAHEKGVIHRDLKPANVMITEGDKVRILDFGLAKPLSDETQAADASHSPTITEALTRPGIVLGTAAYMSPEQAKGKAVDKRADIWAFGCILYECLAGKRAFEGQKVTETLAAVLKSEPDWDALPETTPVNVHILLKRCLQRDLTLRYRDIADAWLEVESPTTIGLQTPSAHRRLSRAWAAFCSFVMLAAGILIGPSLVKALKPSVAPPITKTTIDTEPGIMLAGAVIGGNTWRPTQHSMAISSDGSFLVYCGSDFANDPEGDNAQLYLRRMGQLKATPIPGRKEL